MPDKDVDDEVGPAIPPPPWILMEVVAALDDDDDEEGNNDVDVTSSILILLPCTVENVSIRMLLRTLCCSHFQLPVGRSI